MSNQYQLTNVEAQRIMAVLDELTNDLRYAFRLTPQHLASISDVSAVVVNLPLAILFFCNICNLPSFSSLIVSVLLSKNSDILSVCHRDRKMNDSLLCKPNLKNNFQSLPHNSKAQYRSSRILSGNLRSPNGFTAGSCWQRCIYHCCAFRRMRSSANSSLWPGGCAKTRATSAASFGA